MKVKLNLTVKHSGYIYEKGETYELEDADAQHLLEQTHENVFVPLREYETGRNETVPVAEKAPEDAPVAKPVEAEKTVKTTPATPPVPNV